MITTDKPSSANPPLIVGISNKSMAVITSIPAFFIIPIFMWVALTDPDTALTILPKYLDYLLKFSLIFFFLALLFSRKAMKLYSQLFEKPVIATVGLFVASGLMIYDNYQQLSVKDISLLKSIGPYVIASWLLYPIIHSRWFTNKIPGSIHKPISIILLIIIFLSINTLLVIEGFKLFHVFLPELF